MERKGGIPARKRKREREREVRGREAKAGLKEEVRGCGNGKQNCGLSQTAEDKVAIENNPVGREGARGGND